MLENSRKYKPPTENNSLGLFHCIIKGTGNWRYCDYIKAFDAMIVCMIH